MKTVGQERAAYALKALRELKPQLRVEYKQTIKSVPAMILQNGLGQALAFLASKSKGEKSETHYDWVRSHIEQWVLWKVFNIKDRDLIDVITQATSQDYLKAQREALEILTWLKRFSEAEMFGDQ